MGIVLPKTRLYRLEVTSAIGWRGVRRACDLATKENRPLSVWNVIKHAPQQKRFRVANEISGSNSPPYLQGIPFDTNY